MGGARIQRVPKIVHDADAELGFRHQIAPPNDAGSRSPLAIAIRADVTDPDCLQAAIRATVDKFGRLDVHHNNAGGSTARDDTAVNAPLDEFWRAIKLDLYSTFLAGSASPNLSRPEAAQ